MGHFLVRPPARSLSRSLSPACALLYLFKRQRDDRAPTCWFTPQMQGTAGAGLGTELRARNSIQVPQVDDRNLIPCPNLDAMPLAAGSPRVPPWWAWWTVLSWEYFRKV